MEGLWVDRSSLGRLVVPSLGVYIAKIYHVGQKDKTNQGLDLTNVHKCIKKSLINQSRGRALELVQQQRSPLTKARLASITYVDKAPIDLNRINAYRLPCLGQHCLGNKVTSVERWRHN